MKLNIIKTKDFVHFCLKRVQKLVLFSFGPHQLSRQWVSNTRPGGQNRPGEDPNLAHWMTLENVKEHINSRLLTVFSQVLHLFLLIKTSLIAIHTTLK